jgi:hypothetical protein
MVFQQTKAVTHFVALSGGASFGPVPGFNQCPTTFNSPAAVGTRDRQCRTAPAELSDFLRSDVGDDAMTQRTRNMKSTPKSESKFAASALTGPSKAISEPITDLSRIPDDKSRYAGPETDPPPSQELTLSEETSFRMLLNQHLPVHKASPALIQRIKQATIKI